MPHAVAGADALCAVMPAARCSGATEMESYFAFHRGCGVEAGHGPGLKTAAVASTSTSASALAAVARGGGGARPRRRRTRRSECPPPRAAGGPGLLLDFAAQSAPSTGSGHDAVHSRGARLHHHAVSRVAGAGWPLQRNQGGAGGRLRPSAGDIRGRGHPVPSARAQALCPRPAHSIGAIGPRAASVPSTARPPRPTPARPGRR